MSDSKEADKPEDTKHEHIEAAGEGGRAADLSQQGAEPDVYEDVVDGDIPPGKGMEFRGRAAAVARSLVLETLLAPKEETEEEEEGTAAEGGRSTREAKEERRGEACRRRRSAKNVHNPGNARLYDLLKHERKVGQKVALRTALSRLEKAAALFGARRQHEPLLHEVLRELEGALVGCNAYVGLLQPRGDVLKFVAVTSKSEVLGQSLSRPQGVSFLAVDRGEPVCVTGWSEINGGGGGGEDGDVAGLDTPLGPTQRPRLLGKKERGQELPLLVLPLTVEGGGCVGVLCIDGFGRYKETGGWGPTVPRQEALIQRQKGFAKKAAHSLEAVSDFRLWRSLEARVESGKTEKEPGDRYTAASAIMGRVVGLRPAARWGPYYTLQWEDGLREGEVNNVVMSNNLLAVDRERLGQTAFLDNDVIEVGRRLGALVGETVDACRKGECLRQLRGLTLLQGGVDGDGIFRAALESVVQHVLFTKSAEVWEVRRRGHDLHYSVESVACVDVTGHFSSHRAKRGLDNLSKEARRGFFDRVLPMDDVAAVGPSPPRVFGLPQSPHVLVAPFRDFGAPLLLKRERHVRVQLHEAQRLAVGKRGLFGAGRTDAFAIFRFNGVELRRTPPKPDTTHPKWAPGEEALTLPLPEEPWGCQLVVELWDLVKGHATGMFLGRAVLHMEDLLYPSRGVRGFDLQGRPERAAADATVVQGQLLLSVKALRKGDGDTEGGEEGGSLQTDESLDSAHMPLLSLTIKGAKGLARVDRLAERSSPLVVVSYEGREVGRTKVAHKTLDPLWDEDFQVRLSGDYMSAELCLQVRDRSPPVKGEGPFLGSVSLPVPRLVGGQGGEEEVTLPLAGKVGLSDKENAGVRGVLVVGYSVTMPPKPLGEEGESGGQQARGTMSVGTIESNEGGAGEGEGPTASSSSPQVATSLLPVEHGGGEGVQRISVTQRPREDMVRVHVHRAEGLAVRPPPTSPKVGLFAGPMSMSMSMGGGGGPLDVCCVLHWNGAEVRRTAVARKSASPVWAHEEADLPIRQTPKSGGGGGEAGHMLKVEVWEVGTLGGLGECLGQVCVPLTAMREASDKGGPPLAYPLTMPPPHGSGPRKPSSLPLQGLLHLSFSRVADVAPPPPEWGGGLSMRLSQGISQGLRLSQSLSHTLSQSVQLSINAMANTPRGPLSINTNTSTNNSTQAQGETQRSGSPLGVRLSNLFHPPSPSPKAVESAQGGEKREKEEGEGVVLRVQVHGVSGLAKHDLLGTQADAFVAVLWEGREVGRTPLMPKASEEATWQDQAIFHLHTHTNGGRLNGTLTLRAWDSGRSGATLLAEAVLRGHDEILPPLDKEKGGGEGGKRSVEMRRCGLRSPLSPSRRPRLAISTCMERDGLLEEGEGGGQAETFRAALGVTRGARPKRPRRLQVTVHRASGLSRVDFFARPSPFYVLKCNGREFGRGGVVRRALDPIFHDPPSAVLVGGGEGEGGEAELVIELWSDGRKKPHTKQQEQEHNKQEHNKQEHNKQEQPGRFLGQASVSLGSLLRGPTPPRPEHLQQLVYSLRDPYSYSHSRRPSSSSSSSMGNVYVSLAVTEPSAAEEEEAALALAESQRPSPLSLAESQDGGSPHALRLTQGRASLDSTSPLGSSGGLLSMSINGGARGGSSLGASPLALTLQQSLRDEEMEEQLLGRSMNMHMSMNRQAIPLLQPPPLPDTSRTSPTHTSGYGRGGGEAFLNQQEGPLMDDVLLASGRLSDGGGWGGQERSSLGAGRMSDGARMSDGLGPRMSDGLGPRMSDGARTAGEEETQRQQQQGETQEKGQEEEEEEEGGPLEVVPLGSVRLKVLEAWGLGTADACGTSDPFGILRWDGREVGRTRVLEKTLHPVWEDAHFDVVLEGDHQRSALCVELWDMNEDGVGEFLGLVRLPVEELLGSSNGLVSRELGCKRGMDKAAQRLVQGCMSLCWDYCREGGEEEGEGEEERGGGGQGQGMPSGLDRRRFGGQVVMHALVTTRQVGVTWASDVSFCKRLAPELEYALLCVRSREARARERALCLQELARLCDDWARVPLRRLLCACRYAMERCLPTVDCYLALLQRGGEVLVYVESTRRSRMTGHRLRRGEGCSFDVIVQGKESVLLREGDMMPPPPPKRMSPGDRILIAYGRTPYAGLVLRWAGQDCYDVLYEGSREKEAAVHISRLTYVPPPRPLLRRFEGARAGWPFVCVPLRNGEAAVGVLSADGFEKADKGRRDEEPPEHGVVEWMGEVGRLLGRAVDLQRKAKGLQAIAMVTRDAKATSAQVLRAVVDVLLETVLFARKLEVWHEDRGRPQSLARLLVEGAWVGDGVRRGRRDNSVPTDPAAVLSKVREGLALEARAQAKKRKTNTNRPTGLTTEDKDKEEEGGEEDGVSCRAYDPFPAILVGRFKSWELRTLGSPLGPLVGGEEEESVCKHSWLLLYREPGIVWREDGEFLTSVCAGAEAALLCVHGREFRSRARGRLVGRLVKLCEEWGESDTKRLVSRVVEGLGKCFMGSDVYLALLLPGGEQMEFRYATRRSLMVGKRLARGGGVGFDVVDGRSQLVVKGYSSPDAFRLRVFGESLLKCLPFVCTPLLRGAGSRCVRGVVSVDGIGRNDNDDHPEPSELELLSEVANALGGAIDRKAKEAALQELRQVVNRTGVGVSDVYNAAIKALRHNLPLSTCIERWCLPLHPLALPGGQGGDTDDANAANRATQQGAITCPRQVCLEIHGARNLARAGRFGKSDPFVIIKWNEEEIARTAVVPKSLEPKWEERVEFTADGDRVACSLALEVWDMDAAGPGEFLGQVVFRGLGLSEGCCSRSELELRAKPGQDPHSQRLVQGKLCLSLHIADLSEGQREGQREEEKKALVGPRRLQLQVHRAQRLPTPGFLRACDPFVVVKWGGREVGRTQAVAKSTDPKWEDAVFDVTVTPPMVVHMSSTKRGSEALFDRTRKSASLSLHGSGSLAGGREGSLTWHQGLLLEVYRTEGQLIGRVGVSMEEWARGGGAVERPKGFDIIPLRKGAGTDKQAPVGTLFLRCKVKDPADPASLTDLPPCREEGGEEEGPVWPLLRIDVVKAVGLSKADYFGKSDPFCILTWKGQDVGRTRVVEKSLDPLWEGEHFDLPLVGGLEGEGEEGSGKRDGLLVEVYDMNRTGRGMFLGQVLLTADVLAKSGREERAPQAYFLHPKPVPATTTPRGGDTSPSSSNNNSGSGHRWSAASFSFAPSSASFSSSGTKTPGSLGALTLAYDVIRNPTQPPALRAVLRLEPQRLSGLPPPASPPPPVSPATMGKAARPHKVPSSSSSTAYVLVLRCNGQEVGRTPRRAPTTVTAAVPPPAPTGETAAVVAWRPREVGLCAQSDGGYHVDETELLLELWECSNGGAGKGGAAERQVAVATLGEAHFRVPPSEEDAGLLSGVTEHSRVCDLLLRPVGPDGSSSSVEGTEAGQMMTLSCRCVCVLRAEDHPLWVADPGLSLLQLKLLRAVGLAKADLFGNRDPFVIVKWGQEEVGRSKVAPKTLDPVWEGEQFSVDMQGDPGHTPLTLEVWDMGALGGVGEFLGLATLLRSQLARESDPEVALELMPRPQGPGDKHVKGTLFIKYQKASPAEVKHFDTIVKLSVLEAHGLAKADLLGKSDPFVIVKWEGREVGRTRVVHKTLDPLWGEDGSFSVEQTGDAMEGLLTLELWDMNGDKQGSFLGQVVLKGADLRTPTEGSAQFDLQPRARATKAEAGFVRGYLSVAYVTVRRDGRPVPRPLTPDDVAHARALRKIDELLLQVRVHGCVSLSRSALGRGAGSTYCAVKWNGREVGRTPSLSAADNPRWDPQDPAAGFRINVPPDRSKMRLQVEVWTQGLLSSNAELLGWVTLRNDFLIHAAVGPRPYRLQRSDGRPDRYPSLESFVVLELGVDSRLWADCVRLLDSPPALLLQIHDARGLAKADLFGQSDPFCIIKWAGREVGRTKVIDSTLDPDWEDEKFELTLPEDPTAVELVVEVWDMDRLGMGDFLGQAMLSCGELLRLPPTRIEYALRGKKDGAHRENRLVQGRLGFSVKQKSVDQQHKSRLRHEVRPYVRGLESRTRSELGLSSIDLQTLFQTAARPGGSSCILYEEREMVVATFSDLRVRVGGEWVGPSEGCYRYALTACGPTHYSTFEDAVFARLVIQETQVALRRLRGRQQRAAAWDLALAKMRTVAENFVDYDTSGYYQALLDCLELPLLGCDMYLSLLAGGGQLLRCVGATAESGMLGKEWRRGVGVSFRCVGSGFKTFLVVQLPHAKPGADKSKRSDLLSATSAMGVVGGAMDGTSGDGTAGGQTTLTSTATEGLGLNLGTSVVSIRKPRAHGRTLFDQMRVLGDKGRASMPFVCVPLLHERCTVGVLGVDNFNQVGGGEAHSPHPEAVVLDRLKEAGAILGAGMDRKRRHDALVAFDRVVSGQNMCAEELYGHALRCLLLHSPFGVKAQVWKLDERWDLHVMASVAHTKEEALHSGARMLRVSRPSLAVFPQAQLGQRDFFLKLTCGGLERRAALRCAGDLPFWDERFDFKIAKGVQCLHAELWALSDGGEVACLGRTTVSVAAVAEGRPSSLFVYLHAPAPLTESVNQAAVAVANQKGPGRQSRPSLTGNKTAGRASQSAAAAPLSTSTAARPPIARLTLEAMVQPIDLGPIDALTVIRKAEAGGRKSLRLTIVEAHNLARADLLGSSDPFVVVRWNERELGRTETVANSLNPKWDSEVFNLNLPHGGASASLVLEVWDQDAGRKGDFLGQATVSAEELLARAAAREPVVLALGDKPEATTKRTTSSKEVKGEVVVTVEARDGAFVEGRVGQVDKRLRDRMMDLIDGVRQQMGVYADKDVTRSSDGGPTGNGSSNGNVVLRLTVVDALRLPVTNVMVLAKVNGVEKARTRVLRDTDSPKWRAETRPEEHSFVLAFDALPSRSAELELCLEVWTAAGCEGGGLGLGDLLPVPLRCVGMVLLRGERLHRLPKGDVEYDLERPRPCPGVRPSDVPVQGVLCVNAAWAALQPQVTGYEASGSVNDKKTHTAPGSLDYIPRLGGSSLMAQQPLLLRLEVFGAEDLPRADAFGSTDPYCVLKWRRKTRVARGSQLDHKARWSLNGSGAASEAEEEGEEEWEEEEEEEEVGRSHVVLNSLHPDFEDAVFYPRLRQGDELRHMALVLEVWGKGVMGPGALLGAAVVGEGEALLEPCLPTATRDLYPKQAKLKKSLPPQGRVRFLLSRQDPAFSRQVLEVNVRAAHGLANADFMGKSDPVVRLFYDGREAGRTRTLQNTLHPVWDETFVLHLPVLTDPGAGRRAHLRLEVWDMDLASQGDFLGMVEIEADELLQPTGRPETYRLQPKPGQAKKLNLVQGFLELRWVHRCLRLCAAPPERPVSHVVRENVSLGVDVMLASDPVAEELRLRKEKLKLPDKMARTLALAELCDSVLGNPAYRKGMELKAFEATVEMPQPGSPDAQLGDQEEEDEDEDEEEEETGMEGAAAGMDEHADLPDPESTLMSEVASGQLVLSFVRRIGATVLRGILYDRLVVTFSDDSHYQGSRHAAPGYALVLYTRAQEVYSTDRAFGKQVAQRLAEQLSVLRSRQTRGDKRQQALFRLAALGGPHTTPASWAAYLQQRTPGSGTASTALTAPALPPPVTPPASPKAGGSPKAGSPKGPGPIIRPPPPAPFTPETLVREALRLLSSALGPSCTISVYLLRHDPEAAAWGFKLAGSTLFATTHHTQGREAMQPPKPVTIHRGEAGSAHLFRVVEEEVVMLQLDQRLRLGHPCWASISQGEMLSEKEGGGGGGGGDFLAAPLWDRDQPVGVLEVTGIQSLAIQGQRPESSGGGEESGGSSVQAQGVGVSLNQAQETVLEDGVVGFVRDAAVQLGTAVARLRKRACIEGVSRQLERDESASPKAEETVVPTLLRQTAAWLRAACPYATSVSVWELTTDLESLRDPEEGKDKEGKEALLQRSKTGGLVVVKEGSSAKQLLLGQGSMKSGTFVSPGSLSPVGSDAGGAESRAEGSLDTGGTLVSCTGDSLHASWTLPGLFSRLNCLPGGDGWKAAGSALGRCFGAPETEADVAAAARVAGMKPSALRIPPTARFSIQSSDAEVSTLPRTGRLKLGPLELPGGPLALETLAREWYRQLLNVEGHGAEFFYASTGHLVLLLRRRTLPLPPKKRAAVAAAEEEEGSGKSRRGFSLRAMSSRMSSRAFGLGGEGQDRQKAGSPKRPLRPEAPEETEARDYAIVIGGWMDRVDLDFVVKVARLVNQVMAMHERQRKPAFF